jgi:carbamoyl-phosphate synthase large subunit
MGTSDNFGIAFAKAQAAAGAGLPGKRADGQPRRAFLSVNNRHKDALVPVAKKLIDLGFELVCTQGTGARLAQDGLTSEFVFKVHEGRPNIVDRIKNKEIQLVINTPLGAASKFDEKAIRRATVETGLPYVTTLAAARVTVEAIEHLDTDRVMEVSCLQDLHKVARG